MQANRYILIERRACEGCSGNGKVNEYDRGLGQVVPVDCPLCKGSGTENSEIDLADAIRHLRLTLS